MTTRERNGAAVGFLLGAFLGYLFFNDSEPGSNVVLATVLPMLVTAVAWAFIGYYFVRQGAKKQSRG